ncbi:MAG: hypothetical protein AB7N91_12380 [Candidatus Tectimicrobiota bacterium]
MTQPARPLQWWHAVDRRTFNTGALAFTALLSLSGCKSEKENAADSLKLQQEHGWNVGAKETRLFFLNVADKDAMDSTEWRPYTDPARLIAAWQPRADAWQAFYTPTLMQALKDESLRAQMRLIFHHGMREAFARGETLRRDLLSQVEKGGETFFIVDLPGPEAVAFGAGLSSWGDVISGFENWPHPNGVVRSHDTLAAMLYYASYIEAQKKKLPDGSPGVLLLDSQRLAAYTDEDSQFDNRYIATVPSPAALRQRGVKNIMYVVPNREQKTEADDLNDDFVAYKDANLKVALFPLNDLKRVSEQGSKKTPDGSTQPVTETRYYYGGGLDSHLGFLLLYSFLAPRPTLYYPPPVGYPYQPYPPQQPYPAGGGSGGVGGGGWRSTTLDSVRPPSTPAPSYNPSPRATVFSRAQVGGQAGVGRTKPSGFGRTTFRSSGGRFTGLGRSGSLGRGGSGSS